MSHAPTYEIAQRLNALRLLAEPYTIGDDCVISGGHKERDAQLAKRLQPIMDAATPACDLAEIAAAARERRDAEVLRVELRPHDWRKEIPWAGTRAIWLWCLPKLREVVSAYNAEILAEYERYRLACESGTALSPEKEREAKLAEARELLKQDLAERDRLRLKVEALEAQVERLQSEDEEEDEEAA